MLFRKIQVQLVLLQTGHVTLETEQHQHSGDSIHSAFLAAVTGDKCKVISIYPQSLSLSFSVFFRGPGSPVGGKTRESEIFTFLPPDPTGKIHHKLQPYPFLLYFIPASRALSPSPTSPLPPRPPFHPDSQPAPPLHVPHHPPPLLLLLPLRTAASIRYPSQCGYLGFPLGGADTLQL